MRIIINILLAFSFALSTSIWAEKIALNQFSMLFPLPAERLEDLPGLEISKDNVFNCSQDFFSREMFRGLPDLVLSPMAPDQNFDRMRLVGLRWDTDNQEARLIFQPLTGHPGNERGQHLRTEDAALHLFFRAPSESVIANELRRLARRFRGNSLTKIGVHSSFTKADEVATRLNGVLCRIAHWNLYKVTFMTERRGRVMWHFGGFDVLDEAGLRSLGAAVAIPNLPETFEDHHNKIYTSVQRMVRGVNRLRANVHPQATGENQLNDMFNEGSRVFAQQGTEKVRRRIDRLENPHMNSPSTVDCISCHAVESARRVAERDYASTPSEFSLALPTGYGLSSEISILELENTVNLRSFGYFDFEPVISRRVLLESYLFQKQLSL